MPIYTIDGIEPEFEDEASNWIAPDAIVIGRVRIGSDAGIWFGAAMRGDNEPIDDRRAAPTCRSTSSCTPIPGFR